MLRGIWEIAFCLPFYTPTISATPQMIDEALSQMGWEFAMSGAGVITDSVQVVMVTGAAVMPSSSARALAAFQR